MTTDIISIPAGAKIAARKIKEGIFTSFLRCIKLFKAKSFPLKNHKKKSLKIDLQNFRLIVNLGKVSIFPLLAANFCILQEARACHFRG